MTKFGFSAVALLAFVVLAASPVLADPCPQAVADPGGIINGTGTSNSPYETFATGNPGNNCNIIITFNADSSITTSLANPNPYDGIEDQLVGVINNTSSPITSFLLNEPGIGIFGFDGDGICAYQPFVANGAAGACNSGSNLKTDPGDYLGTASSFSGISLGFDSGFVNFAGIAGGGGTGYFSLEEPASLNLGVNVPEPASVLLLGSALLALGYWRRTNRKNA